MELSLFLPRLALLGSDRIDVKVYNSVYARIRIGNFVQHSSRAGKNCQPPKLLATLTVVQFAVTVVRSPKSTSADGVG